MMEFDRYCSKDASYLIELVANLRPLHHPSPYQHIFPSRPLPPFIVAMIDSPPLTHSPVDSTENPTTSTADIAADDSSDTDSPAAQCPVCGELAFHRHFGALTCRACAAFFRRTIAFQTLYTCSRQRRCLISRGVSRRMCKFCRFQRCVEIGMNMSGIYTRGMDELACFEASSPLRKALMAQRSTFAHRYEAHLRAHGGDHALIQLGGDRPSEKQASVAAVAEFTVMAEYIRETGLREYATMEFAEQLFYPWLCFRSVQATLRHSGQKQNCSYYVDECAFRVCDETIRSFVNTFGRLLDHQSVKKYTSEFIHNNLQVARRFDSADLEEFEHAAVFHLFALRTAHRLRKERKDLSNEINDLFRHLKSHYMQNRQNEFELRVANVVMLLAELEEHTRLFTEYATVLYLNGYTTVLATIRNAKTAEKFFNEGN